MRLKSLEILGFKSFRNRTKIHFTDGITALIGPNGCGKTNIVDAIRWTLGELSPSLLRCEKMEDLIFSGTSERKELGLAEVTLTILNDDGEIPLDYSEVAITRRLYRSSESEYYINRNLCRLKEIHSLLLNTGVSHRAYSVFENAMINRILSKDSTYKRLFFEEASKIVKYRERKNEALRKLETTKNDMKNLKEVIAEAERYTSSLKRQANKARRYSELKEKLSLMKASSSKEHYIQLKEWIADESKKFEQTKAKKNQLLETKDHDEQEIKELTSKSDGIGVSIRDCERELKESDGSIRELEKDIVSYKERTTAEKEKSGREQKQLDANIKSKDRIENSISANRVRLDRVTKEIALTRKKLIEFERKLEAMGESNLLEIRDGLIKKEAGISKRVMELETSLESRMARIKSIETEVKSTSEEEQTSLKSLDDCEKTISNLLSEEKELKHRIEEIEEKRNISRQEIVQLEAQLGEISFQLNRKRLSSSPWIQSDYGILKDHLSINLNYEKAIIGALGIRFMSPIMNNDENLLKTVKSLKEQKELRDALLYLKPQPAALPVIPQESSVLGRAIDFVKATHEAKRVLEWLLSDYVIVADLPTALRYSEMYPNLNFSTLEGDVLQSDGTVWTGLFEEDQKDLVNELRKTHTSLSDQLLRIDSEFKSLAKETSNLQIERVRLETERNRLLSETKKINKCLSSLISRLDLEKDEADSLQNELAEENKKLSQVREESNNMELTLSSAGADRETLVAERNELLIKLRVSEERISTITEEIEHDKVALKEREESVKELERTLKDNSTSLGDLESKLSKKFSQLELLINQRNGVLEKKNEAEKGKQDLRERIRYLSERRKFIQNDMDKLNETLHQAEIKLMELTRERSSLRERTVEEYGIDLEQFELVEIADPQEIEKLESSMRRLGVVNPLAQEQYEKEKKRLDFFRTQLNDLMLAKKYLLDTIALIDERAISQFKETFAKVRSNFKTVFSKLFGGGVADLKLGSDSDLFSSSIELVANPKGKNLKTLDALSGGERALVAIAFLFALYLTRPSPFCVLDEIDAALDDANIARFLTFLRDLSAHTQFLVVTHNKRTMEAANSLYGITMEEPGISKIVSVKFRE